MSRRNKKCFKMLRSHFGKFLWHFWLILGGTTEAKTLDYSQHLASQIAMTRRYKTHAKKVYSRIVIEIGGLTYTFDYHFGVTIGIAHVNERGPISVTFGAAPKYCTCKLPRWNDCPLFAINFQNFQIFQISKAFLSLSAAFDYFYRKTVCHCKSECEQRCWGGHVEKLEFLRFRTWSLLVTLKKVSFIVIFVGGLDHKVLESDNLPSSEVVSIKFCNSGPNYLTLSVWNCSRIVIILAQSLRF